MIITAQKELTLNTEYTVVVSGRRGSTLVVRFEEGTVYRFSETINEVVNGSSVNVFEAPASLVPVLPLAQFELKAPLTFYVSVDTTSDINIFGVGDIDSITITAT